MLVNIFGKRGSGKTVMIKGALKHCQAPVVIVDVLGNFSKVEGYHAKDLADAVSFVSDYAKAREEGRLTDETADVLVVQADDPDETAEYLSAALWHSGGGTLILDEIDAINYPACKVFDRIIRYGRNKSVHLLTGCRRPAEISRNITAGANRLFVFQTQEPRDIDYYSKTILGDRAESLISMPDYHGIFVDYDKKLIGTFKTDIEGNVYFLTEEKLSS